LRRSWLLYPSGAGIATIPDQLGDLAPQSLVQLSAIVELKARRGDRISNPQYYRMRPHVE
jgi:hypothetical protein